MGGIEDDPSSQIYRDTGEKFNKINSNITIKYEYTVHPGEDNLDPIVLLQDEESPDIVGLPSFRLNLAREQDLLVDLTSLLETSDLGKLDIPESILRTAKMDGSLLIFGHWIGLLQVQGTACCLRMGQPLLDIWIVRRRFKSFNG